MGIVTSVVVIRVPLTVNLDLGEGEEGESVLTVIPVISAPTRSNMATPRFALKVTKSVRPLKPDNRRDTKGALLPDTASVVGLLFVVVPMELPSASFPTNVTVCGGAIEVSVLVTGFVVKPKSSV